MPLILPGTGTGQPAATPGVFGGRQNVPTSAYEQAIANLGPAFAARLQEIDPGPALNFLQDEMTDTDGVLLSAHTGNSGHTWTIHPAFANTAEINTNRLRSTGSSRANYYSSDVPSGPNYVVEARTVKVGVDVSNTAVFARMNTASPQDGYYLLHRDLTDVWELGRIIAGAATIIAPLYTDVLAVNDIRTVQLRCNGSLIQGIIDGVVRLEATDASITAPGRPGVWVQQSVNGNQIDWVRAYKAASLADSSGNSHSGMAIAGFTMGVDGFGTGEGTVFTDVTPEQGYARFPGYQPFQPGTSRTFAGISKVEVAGGGPAVMFGSRGPLTGTSPVCVLEATGAGFQTVHWVSNVQVMSTLAAQWIGVLPAIGTFFHWAFTVVDTGSGNQTVHLFINGVDQGPSISGFQQPTWDASSGDYMLGMRAGAVEAAPLHEFIGRNGMQAVFNSILTPTQITNLARTAGFLDTAVPLQASSAVSSATLAVTAATGVPLQAASAVSTATLNLTAPAIVPLQASSAQSSATLFLTAQTQVPLQASSAVASGTLALTAQTTVALGASSAVASATLALTAATRVTLGASSAQSSATLALFTPQIVPLGASSAVSSATLFLTAQTQVPLGASSVVTTATLALTATTQVVLGASSAVSSATLALTAQTYIVLGASSAQSSATLVVTIPGSSVVPLSASSALASATLALTAKTTVALNAASGVASGTLALTAPALLTLSASSAVSSATLQVSKIVPLGASTAISTATLVVRTTAVVPLATASITSSATLTLVPFVSGDDWVQNTGSEWPQTQGGEWVQGMNSEWPEAQGGEWIQTSDNEWIMA